MRAEAAATGDGRETDESWRKGRGAPAFDATIEVQPSVDGDQVKLEVEIPDPPLDKIAFSAAGWQIRAGNLAAHLAGRERGDTEARRDQLVPPHQDLAASIGWARWGLRGTTLSWRAPGGQVSQAPAGARQA